MKFSLSGHFKLAELLERRASEEPIPCRAEKQLNERCLQIDRRRDWGRLGRDAEEVNAV